MSKPKKDNRFRRYQFDEEDMFSHSHEKEMESVSFPYWKPVWNGQAWEFRNPNGGVLDHKRLHTKLFPGMSGHLNSAAFYQHSPTFFVDWARKILYYMSCEVYVEAEKRFLGEVPKDLPPKEHTAAMKQVDRNVESTVQEFFNSFKE